MKSPAKASSASEERPSLADRLLRLMRGRPEQPAGEAAAGNPVSGDLRLRVREFETSTVRDVMVARVDVAAIEADATLEEALRTFLKGTHSRMPIYTGSLDEPLGFIHIKDVVSELVGRGWNAETLAARELARLAREILFVPESMPLPDLLVQMQSRRIHMALVVDEYGGTAGLVSLEDVVEQIVGDIEDEHDEAPPAIVRRGRTVWDVDGSAELEAIERETGLSLTVEAFEDEIDTISGLASALAGRVPQPGDVIDHPLGAKLEVLEADPRRVTRLRIRAVARAQPAPLLSSETGAGRPAE